MEFANLNPKFQKDVDEILIMSGIYNDNLSEKHKAFINKMMVKILKSEGNYWMHRV